MENQSKSMKSGTRAKVNLLITHVHVAFIVDRYFSENSFALTRSVFRDEASSLFPQSPIPEEVKSLPSLLVIFDEYTNLKVQKSMLDNYGSLEGYFPRRVVADQIAMMVDCYLCQENYSKTRSAFNTEAASLIAKIPFSVDANSTARLLLLLNDYICLKKVMVGRTWMENIGAALYEDAAWVSETLDAPSKPLSLVPHCSIVYDPVSSTSNPMEPESVLTHPPASMKNGSTVFGDAQAAEGSRSNVPVCEVLNKDKETEASDNFIKNQESVQLGMNEQVGTPMEICGSSLDQEIELQRTSLGLLTVTDL